MKLFSSLFLSISHTHIVVKFRVSNHDFTRVFYLLLFQLLFWFRGRKAKTCALFRELQGWPHMLTHKNLILKWKHFRTANIFRTADLFRWGPNWQELRQKKCRQSPFRDRRSAPKIVEDKLDGLRNRYWTNCIPIEAHCAQTFYTCAWLSFFHSPYVLYLCNQYKVEDIGTK